jgi:uncharacterized damage-inducible protein DinB
MTVREFFLASRKNELPAFQRVLNALPRDKFNYKPHDRSPSAQQIVWTMASELGAGIGLVETGTLTFDQMPPAPAPDRMIALFNEHYADLMHRVTNMSEADWNKPARFVVGGQTVGEQPLGNFLWLLHNDAIHHRGQLSTYLRPMGAKVPSIYGPSGDDPGR